MAALRLVDVFAGQFHLLAHQELMPFVVAEQFVAIGDVAVLRLRVQRHVAAHHAYFQRGGAPDDVFGLGGVGHAGQLHHDAVGARLLDNGLGGAQLVYAVMQRGDILLHGIAADLRQQRVGQRHGNLVAVAADLRAFQHFLQFGQGLLHVGRVLERHHKAVFLLADAAHADVLLAHGAADVAGIAVKRFFQRGFHVYLHGEMHAAAQVQAEEHGFGADFFQPFGAVGDLVLGDDVAFAQRGINGIAGGNFGGIGYAHFQAAACDKHAAVLNIGFLQRIGNGFFGVGINADGLSVGGNLDGWGYAV